MIIDIMCSSGSPLGVTPSRIITGVGGAELALLTFVEVAKRMGHTVNVYNNGENAEGFHPIGEFHRGSERDLFIVFRTPYSGTSEVVAKRKIFWSCDQQTSGNYPTDVFPQVDRVVCISSFHANYFQTRYGLGLDRIDVIDLGVRTWEYDPATPKEDGLVIFTTVPGRGLQYLLNIWPAIKARAPHAHLTITSDYRLWGNGGDGGTHEYRLRAVGLQDINYLGMVPRSELCAIQSQAMVLAYTGDYEELFCIAVAEAEVAGAIPVASVYGALPTTNQWGVQVAGHPYEGGYQAQFVDAVVELLTTDQTRRRNEMMVAARTRFDWEKICERMLHF